MMANGDDDPLQVLDLRDFPSGVRKSLRAAPALSFSQSCPCARARDDGNGRRRRSLPPRGESFQ